MNKMKLEVKKKGEKKVKGNESIRAA